MFRGTLDERDALVIDEVESGCVVLFVEGDVEVPVGLAEIESGDKHP